MTLGADAITVGFGRGPRVLDGLSLALRPGAMTAVVGPNGAGKSTLVRTLAGLLTPDSGRVVLDGRDLRDLRAPERASRLAYLPQRGSLAFGYSLRRAIGFGRPRDTGLGANARIEHAAAAVGLSDRLDDPFGELSVGQQQRGSLARALVQLCAGSGFGGDAPSPAPSRWLLADEPTSALDPAHARDALAIFRTLASEGVGVVVVFHDLHAALHADDAVLLDGDGRCVGRGPAAEVFVPQALQAVFGIAFESHAGGRVLVPEGPGRP